MDFNELTKRLEQEMTEDLINELCLYAIREAKRHVWHGKSGLAGLALGNSKFPDYSLPSGESVRSLISLLVLKILDGRNKWDAEKVDLKTYFKKNIKRELGHLSLSKENATIRLSDFEDDEFLLESAPTFSQQIQNPAEMAVLKEQHGILTKHLEELYFYAIDKDEKDLIKVIELIMDGHKPNEIAQLLKIKNNDVYNLRKKLQRLLNDFKKEYKNYMEE